MDLEILDSRQLRAFVVLAREGSFTKAGRILHLTQSAISHAIRSLEEDLGCLLFLRQGRQVHLTLHGRELLRHAEAIHLQMAQARRSLGALDRNPRGQLRIGCTPAASQFILPTVLREFKDSFPLYGILVMPGETPDIMERLDAGSLDMGISLKPRDESRVDFQPLFEDELLMIASARHPWRHEPPKPKQMAEESFIVSSRNSMTFELIREYFLKLGVRPKAYLELGNIETIKELAKLGIGVALSATWTCAQEIKSGELIPIPLPRTRIKRQWVVSHLKGKPMTLAEHAFMGLCQEVAKSLGETAA